MERGKGKAGTRDTPRENGDPGAAQGTDRLARAEPAGDGRGGQRRRKLERRRHCNRDRHTPDRAGGRREAAHGQRDTAPPAPSGREHRSRARLGEADHDHGPREGARRGAHPPATAAGGQRGADQQTPPRGGARPTTKAGTTAHQRAGADERRRTSKGRERQGRHGTPREGWGRETAPRHTTI